MSTFLPMEIVDQILCRLPLPVAVKFTRVCKQWQSLIGSIDYNPTCLSSSNSLPNSDGLLVVNYSSLNALPYPVLRCLDPGNFDGLRPRSYYMPHQWVVGSIHNLICIFSLLQDIFIWHPVITRYIHVPQHEFTDRDVCMMILGFGFDAVSNDYKVVKMAVGGVGEFDFEVQVFSLKESKWRDIRGQWLVPGGVYFGAVATGFFFNGAIHWLGSWANRKHVILTFDVLNECFYSIELPDALSDPLACIFLCEIKGSLAIIHNDDMKDDVPACNIWVMRDSWTKICSFGKQKMVTVVKALEGGDIWLVKRDGPYHRNRTEIVSYNPSSGVIKPTGIHGFFSALYGKVIIHEPNFDGESGIACFGHSD